MLENEVIQGITFEKIPDSTITFNNLTEQVKNAYGADEIKHISESEVIILKNKIIICSIKYIPHGVPGYVVRSP
jgi:hypothetical protein